MNSQLELVLENLQELEIELIKKLKLEREFLREGRATNFWCEEIKRKRCHFIGFI